MEQLDLDRPTTDHRSGVGVAARAEPAPAKEDTPETPRWLTIGQRLAAIRDECFGIGKQTISMESAKGGKYTIQAHTVEAILAEIRPLLSKHGVDLTPSLVERSYSGNRCDVTVDFKFDVLDWAPDDWPHERDVSRTVRWAGAGTDNGDKGFAKAGTNALKEMLKKLFLVTDRDDAKEEIDSVEHQTEEGAGRAKLEKVTEQRRATVEQWAKTFKMALEKATEAKDVERLKRDNTDQLTGEDLPEVTRLFFFELIQKRLTELK